MTAKNISALTLGITLLISGCSDNKTNEVVSREDNPDYVRVNDDSLINKAIAEAKETLPQFEKALALKKPHITSLSIKKDFPYGNKGNTEHIWITDVTAVHNGFQGKIGNEPVDVQNLVIGQTVTVKKNEISDWMYFENGKLEGGYTIVALVYGTPDQKQYEQNMGINWKKYNFIKK